MEYEKTISLNPCHNINNIELDWLVGSCSLRHSSYSLVHLMICTVECLRVDDWEFLEGKHQIMFVMMIKIWTPDSQSVTITTADWWRRERVGLLLHKPVSLPPSSLSLVWLPPPSLYPRLTTAPLNTIVATTR